MLAFFPTCFIKIGNVNVYLGIKLYILLRPYLCFISFLYLDLYLLGDDAVILSFMETPIICLS